MIHWSHDFNFFQQFCIIQSFVSVTANISAPIESVIRQFADQVSCRLIPQLTQGISSFLQKLLKYFNGTAISTPFVLPSAESVMLSFRSSLECCNKLLNVFCVIIALLYQIICDALRDLVPFLQIKKREKHPWRRVTFSKVAGYQLATLLKVTLLHGCFSRFLNCINDTKSWKPPHVLITQQLQSLHHLLVGYYSFR